MALLGAFPLVLFGLLISPLGLSKRKSRLPQEEAAVSSLLGDLDLSFLLSKSADLREVSGHFAEKLQSLLQVESLSLYLFSEISGVFQLFLSRGPALPLPAEIEDATLSGLKEKAEPLSCSQALFEISARELSPEHHQRADIPLVLIPLGPEVRRRGVVVTSTPGRGLNTEICRLAGCLCQAMSTAFALEEHRGEVTKLKEQYHRAEIQKGELTHRLQQKIFNLNSLFHLSNRLFAIHDEAELVKSLLEMVKELLGVHFTAFCGCEVGAQPDLSILCRGAFGLSSADLPRLPTGSSFHRYLEKHREPISLPALLGIKPGESFLLKLMEFNFKAMCGIYSGRQLYGLVLCGPKLDGKSYHHGDLEALSILCNMTSVALQNIRQFRLIEELSYTDSMTGLYNYRYFYRRLTEELSRARRHLRKLSLVIFDLDEFKSYNDRFGHQIGDEILRQLATHTKTIVRSIDLVCRYGGEEFCVIMPDTDREEVERFIERLRNEIANYCFRIEHLDCSPKITASVGAAVFPDDADAVDRLVYCADMALLEAKKKGRNLAFLFSPEILTAG